MFDEVVGLIGKSIEALGIAVLLAGVLYSTVRYLRRVREDNSYRDYRRRLGRSILLGLELLVAADIVMTVTAQLTLESMAPLAVLVLVRTFLSLSIEMEMEGVLPWRRAQQKSAASTQ